MMVRLPLVFEGKTTVRDVVQILEPLKVGDRHTTSVDVQIRNDEDVPLDQDLVSGRSGGSVSSLGDDLKRKPSHRLARRFFVPGF